MDLTVIIGLGIALVIVGVIVVVAAIILASLRGAKHGNVRAGGVIMIGPIPIIFGTDKKAIKSAALLALALMVTALIVLLVYYWLLR